MTKDERFALIYSAAANFAAEGRFPFEVAIARAIELWEKVGATIDELGPEWTW